MKRRNNEESEQKIKRIKYKQKNLFEEDTLILITRYIYSLKK
jgi:hypothetical protein